LSGTASSLVAAGLTALAVKLMDDALDLERDRAAGRRNWALALEGGAASYALAIFALAAALDGRTAAALLLAAFGVGMGTGGERLPLGLRAWHESALALLLALLLCGWRLAAAATLASLCAQALDDLLDGHARRGTGETLLGGLAAGLGAAALQPAVLAAVGAGALLSAATRRA
jgi:hypothetical protein